MNFPPRSSEVYQGTSYVTTQCHTEDRSESLRAECGEFPEGVGGGEPADNTSRGVR